MNRRQFLTTSASVVPLFAARGFTGALPSPRQLRRQKLELTAFLHFGVNTFTDREWGNGDEEPNLFHPEELDAEGIVNTLADAGIQGVILTCKHHDGFCLWPTATTEHSVKASKWRDGKGDVVRAFSDAAGKRGLPFGVYLSPWDRNNAAYGTPAYIEIYRRQLTELLTNYGPVYEVWHDGANGGDGFYGGAREKRLIDKQTYYDWPHTWELVRKLQPDAVIFSDVGPDLRWVGNENGTAGDPCWATYDPVGADGGLASPGNVREKDSITGTRWGSRWMPAECDVSIRPGWFWHEAENRKVKTPEQLMELYYESVGLGASLLLNVPPNRNGQLSAEDVRALRGFQRLRQLAMGTNLAAGATVARSGNIWTYRLKGAKVPMDLMRLRERTEFGQRIERVEIEYRAQGEWSHVASITSVGSCRLVRFPDTVTTDAVRLKITASAEPKIAEMALFLNQD
jgi:alpha-L-fucosidase